MTVQELIMILNTFTLNRDVFVPDGIGVFSPDVSIYVPSWRKSNMFRIPGKDIDFEKSNILCIDGGI